MFSANFSTFNGTLRWQNEWMQNDVPVIEFGRMIGLETSNGQTAASGKT